MHTAFLWRVMRRRKKFAYKIISQRNNKKKIEEANEKHLMIVYWNKKLAEQNIEIINN